MKQQRVLVMLNMSYRSDWDKGVINRNYHVQQALIASKEFDAIVSIDVLPFNLKKRFKVLIEQRPWKRNAQTAFTLPGVRVDNDEQNKKLYHVSATRIQKRTLTRLLKKIGMRSAQLVLWSYDPFRADLIKKFPEAITVFDAVDNWAEHPNYKAYADIIRERYASIQEHADIVFTVSESLLKLFQKNPHAYYIPNGVDVDHFAQRECAVQELRALKGPIIGYHGIIQERINFKIVDYLAQKHEDYQFVFIGPVWSGVSAQVAQLKKRPNVHFIGRIPYADLPQAISCFDIAMIPHKIDEFTQTMNPLKMYEYLAAGKPIIATAIAGADQLGELITTAISPEDFSEQIEHWIATDDPEQMERRMVAAEQHSWDVRTAAMHAILNDQLDHESA